MTAPAGAVNAWKCDACGSLLVAVHAAEGVTPMFLACRVQVAPGRACGGRAVSAGYPPAPIPPEILSAVAWEWRQATTTERKRYRRHNPQMLDHVDRGGLVLDRLSALGRRHLPADR